MERAQLFVGLVRVSTEKQSESGLGLEGQRADIRRHCESHRGEIIEEYIEVESGKHNDIQRRPKLRAAVEHAIAVDGTLLIAKLDRLVRSTSVMEYLRQRKVKFVACDNPHANEFTVDILVAVAANEARMISRRTKDALQAYRTGRRVSKRLRALHPEGVPEEVAEATAGKLGAELPQCRNLDDDARALGRQRSAEARRLASASKAEQVRAVIARMVETEPAGLADEEIARRLNDRRIRTPRGKEGSRWTGKQVARVMGRHRG